MYTDNILKLAVFAGKIILENGGETYRTEDTITRMLENKVDIVETFVTPTGIFASVEVDGKILTIVRRVKKRIIDLNKVALVNDFSRRFAKEKGNNIDCNKYIKELNDIDKKKKYNYYFRITSAGIAAAASGMMIGNKLYDFIPTFITAILLQALVAYFEKLKFSTFIINILGGSFVSVFAILFSKMGIGSLDGIIIGSIMTLVPGVTLTNAVRDAISGDFLSGVSRGIEAVVAAISIAVGVGALLKIWFILGGIL
jgi:uncharacterized membrane protein YjjP (DUF1212 family)